MLLKKIKDKLHSGPQIPAQGAEVGLNGFAIFDEANRSNNIASRLEGENKV